MGRGRLWQPPMGIQDVSSRCWAREMFSQSNFRKFARLGEMSRPLSFTSPDSPRKGCSLTTFGQLPLSSLKVILCLLAERSVGRTRRYYITLRPRHSSKQLKSRLPRILERFRLEFSLKSLLCSCGSIRVNALAEKGRTFLGNVQSACERSRPKSCTIKR